MHFLHCVYDQSKSAWTVISILRVNYFFQLVQCKIILIPVFYVL